MSLAPALRAYVVVWLCSCVAAVVLALRSRASTVLFRREYWRFLGRPWRLTTFVVAATGLTAIAPYTGDPTWDYVDASVMSGLTFGTAPWSLGTLYRCARGREPRSAAFVAAVTWMFGASWSYDGYLLLRDHAYPPSWASNIVASSVLYVSAGLFWSLDFQAGRGMVFAFMRDDWPPAGDASFRDVAPIALVFMVLVSCMIATFFVPRLH